MRWFLYFFILGLAVLAQANSDPTLSQLRIRFKAAVVDKEVEDFFNFCQINTSLPSTHKAYKASSYALMTSKTWNPFTKIKRLNTYEQLMKEAYQSDTSKIEIRFLRLSMEYNIPRWLGMSNHLKEDKEYIVAHINDIKSLRLSPAFAKYILYFFKQTGLFSSTELSKIATALPKS